MSEITELEETKDKLADLFIDLRAAIIAATCALEEFENCEFIKKYATVAGHQLEDKFIALEDYIYSMIE